jgi:hypothetical protein
MMMATTPSVKASSRPLVIVLTASREPSICAITTSGLTATPRSTAATTRVKRRKRRNGFRQSGADGETRYTLSLPLRDTASGANRPTATVKAERRFLAVRMRSLNDPRQGSLPTVQTVTLLSVPPRHLQAKTDPSVTIRLLIPTPAQRVSHICAETDGLTVPHPTAG